jgi:hypothetical protein
LVAVFRRLPESLEEISKRDADLVGERSAQEVEEHCISARWIVDEDDGSRVSL